MTTNNGRLLQNIYTVTDDQGNVRQKTAEQKQYLILEKFSQVADSEPCRIWSVLTGRSQVLEFLLDELNSYGNDLLLDESLIIVEGVDITEAQKLVDFLEYCLDKGYVTDSEQADVFEHYTRLCRDEVDEQEDEEDYEAPSSEARNDNLLSNNHEYQEV